MTQAPAELVHALEARGARLTPRSDGALVVTPKGILTDQERVALQVHKMEVVVLLLEREARTAAGTDWTRVSLYQLDKVLEIVIPWSDVPLILAPGCRLARELRGRDPKHGRVWCTCEVLNLLLTSVPPDDAQKIATTSIMFDATSNVTVSRSAS